jgi:hypothetical protein
MVVSLQQPRPPESRSMTPKDLANRNLILDLNRYGFQIELDRRPLPNSKQSLVPATQVESLDCMSRIEGQHFFGERLKILETNLLRYFALVTMALCPEELIQ